MTDSRSISGTVNVKQRPDCADVAYRMARDIWENSGKAAPKVSDEEFIRLVSTCSTALLGNYSRLDYAKAI